MVLVTGLRIPWATAQANNPAFDVSASQLADPLNQINADAVIDWTTILQDNIIALNNFVVSADGIIVPANRELIGLAGGLAINVPTGTPFDVRINNVSIGRFNETNLLLSVPLDMGTNLINNVVDPVGAQDAATRNYVDTTTNIVTAANVGAGTGDVFRDKIGTTINLRTLLAGTNIGIVTAGDEITISQTGAATHNLLSATHPDTVPASPPAQGSLIKGNGSNLWQEFVLGGALQIIRVNAGGTDLEFATVAGATDELVNLFEGGVQVGSVARQLNFNDVNDFVIVENGGANRFDITINTNAANGIAGLDASSRLAEAQLPTSAALTNTSNAWADGVKQTFNPDGSFAGINVGQQAGDPSTLVDGDYWYNSSTNRLRARENGISVDVIGAAGAQDYSHAFASSDETTDLTTGVVANDQRVPFSLDIVLLQAWVTVAPVGADLILEVRKDASSAGTVTISAGTKSGTTAIASNTFVFTNVIDVNITQVGSTTAGRGLKVALVGTVT